LTKDAAVVLCPNRRPKRRFWRSLEQAFLRETTDQPTAFKFDASVTDRNAVIQLRQGDKQS
jgi:hypothetical protein